MDNEKIKITKKKPIWLWECNLFHVNGCKLYCSEYEKDIPYHACKRRKALIDIMEEDLDEV